MFGEPGFVEAQPLSQKNLSEQLFESLFFRYPGPCLIIAERAEAHAYSFRRGSYMDA